MKYDVFITIHPKDFFKLEYLIDSIMHNLFGYDKIYVVSPTGEEIIPSPHIIYLKDADVLNIDKTRFKHRPNWMWQMHAKLLQNVTENDWFFTIDSDCIINRELPLFADGKPILYKPDENARQEHVPYFKYQEKLFNLPRSYPSTFITDTNFMSKKIIREMLFNSGFPTEQDFLETSIKTINHDCYLGEPELWGQYVMKHHADEFEVRTMKTIYDARIQSQPEEIAWSKEDYLQRLNDMKSKDVDVFALHSWWDWNV